VINDGIPGETSAQGLARLEDSLEEYQPQLIIICYGANDVLQNLSLDKAQANIEKMIKKSKAFGADVVLVGVPKKALFLESLTLYKTLAESYKIPLENDILADLLSDSSMKSDSVHFNVAGYRAFAAALQNLLQSKGALPK
jgi:lysophospholipase L1-like esterase